MDEDPPVWADAISATYLGNTLNNRKSGISARQQPVAELFTSVGGRPPGCPTRIGDLAAEQSLTHGGLMIRITNLNPTCGRICATFTAEVGGLKLPGCALIRRGDGYGLSVPRIGAPGETRPAPLSPTQLAELERVAIAHHKEKMNGRN